MQPSNKRVWVLEDNEESRLIYGEVLELRCQLRFFQRLADFESAWLACRPEEKPDLLIADLRLSDGNFINFLKAPKSAPPPPFIVVSSVDDLDVLRLAFKDGALDYLTKPFRKTELVVKVERILNGDRARSKDPQPSIQIDSTRLQVKTEKGHCAQLTSKELQIFTSIYQAPQQRIGRAKLVESVWGDIAVSAKTLDVHLSNLRQKLVALGLEVLFVPPDHYTILGDESSGSLRDRVGESPRSGQNVTRRSPASED